ncbi:MAG: pyridoxal phosphate-dependent aminotransferase [Muribaculaceae bacterium]|nr:pyridoxal phosphate-dependent aminotransferase [Muribaculaceae bacterium]
MELTRQQLEDGIKKAGILDINSATIRQIVGLSKAMEQETGEEYIHLELGNPGLMAEEIGIAAEKAALDRGVANKYPDITGVAELKTAGSKFVKAFLDIDVPSRCIIPTVGSMQACFTLMTLLKQKDPGKDSLLLFTPFFPAQSHQAKLIGFNRVTMDIADYRGDKLRGRLEELLSSGKFAAMLYSNPNNPSWSNFTDKELKIIGEMATKYDVPVIEDLAYLGMDFRKDFSKPYQPPFIPTVAKYTNNYILLISASKIFSYAGQRVAIVCMSPEVYSRNYPEIERFYEMPNFGDAYIFGVLYMASSGVAHSAQFAMAEMLERAADGTLPFIAHTKEYGRRGGRMRQIFEDNGFHLVYAKDGEDEISDGFFFTVGYGNLTSEELQKELMRFGVCTIPLPSTGSTKDGVRVCVSMMTDEKHFDTLGKRLKRFHETHQLINQS